MNDLDAMSAQVEKMLATVRGLPPGERRRKMSAIVLKKAAELEAASVAFAAKLALQWDWCDKNPDHPDFDKREEAVIKNVDRYTAIFESLRSALVTLGEDTDSTPIARPGASMGLSGAPEKGWSK